MKFKMIKALSAVLSAIICTMSFSVVCANPQTIDDEDTVGLIINEEWVSVEQPPILQNDRTLVPLRVISEKLGFNVDWDGVERKVTVSGNNTVLELFIDKTTIIENGASSEMDVAPIIWFDTTMVPLRKVSELLGCSVDWNGIAYVAFVNSPEAVERYNKLSPEKTTYTDKDTILRGYVEKIEYKSEAFADSWVSYHLILDKKSDFILPSEHSPSGTMTYSNVKRVQICPDYDLSEMDKLVGHYISVIGNIQEAPPTRYYTTDVCIFVTGL